MTRQLKGYHVLGIATGAFAIVIGANMAMLFAATGTFPGLVVDNSYVASQEWNDRTAAQKALGWRTEVDYSTGGVAILLTGPDGQPVTGADLKVLVGRPSTNAQDREIAVAEAGGAYRADIELAPGQWRIEVATASGPAYHATAHLTVPEAR